MTHILGVAGFAGSGKSTVAAHLVDQGWKHVKIAQPLKDMMRSFLQNQMVPNEWIERMLEGDLKREPSRYLAGRTPTHAMQTLGGEWGRDLMAEWLWLGPLSTELAFAEDEGLNVVIDDIRYQNEILFLQAQHGHVTWVNRPELTMEAHHNHQSETRLETGSTIDNVGTIPELLATVDHIFGRNWTS